MSAATLSSPVLVTGGTGFVGSAVIPALLAADLPVRCLVRNPGRAGALAEQRCTLVQGDVTDAESLRRAVTGCGAVVHLVSIIAGRPADFERVMSEATRQLVAAAREAGVERFVLMSALGTGEETKELVPYYRAKWAMERAVAESGLGYATLRPSFIFGRHGGLLPPYVALVRYAPVVPVVGSGERLLQPIWADDVASAFLTALTLPAAPNRAFDLVGPDRLSWNELTLTIAHLLGKRRRLLHLPLGLMRTAAAVLERLPKPPLSRDQLTMLEHADNVGDPEPARDLLGLTPITVETQIRRAL